ncbi:hypothetical protein DFS34DRAFT_647208 [Phlyctochytrium arcticum]|nr:hypothetical protein DFS34DRAFT_647208 [Phlyctochytrium arcticum]
MDRSATNVVTVWEEYDRGVPGFLSVKEMNALHKGWRKECVERNWYCNRKFLYDYVERMMAETGRDGITCAQDVDLEIKRKGCTVPTFIKELRKNRKADAGNKQHHQ